MAEIDKRVSAMNTVSSVSANDLALATIVDSGETSGYSSRKITEGNKAQSYLNSFEFPLLLQTTSKSIIGAINELYSNMPSDIENTVFPIEEEGE